MKELGIVLYGFIEKDALAIKQIFDQAFQNDLFLFNADGREKEIVKDILEKPTSEGFSENALKVMLFLGFETEDIKLALASYPKDGSLARPIFCGLTNENINWKWSYLLEHLQEEDAAWRSKGK